MTARRVNSQIYQFWMFCKYSVVQVDQVWSLAEKVIFARQKIVSPIIWTRSHLRYALSDVSRRLFADRREEPDRIKVGSGVLEYLTNDRNHHL